MAKNTRTVKKAKYYMRNAIVNYYLLVMFTFFEMFLTNQYYNARGDKFVLYIVLTSVLTVATLIISMVYWLDKGTHIIENKKIFSFSVTDIAFISFFVCSVITTVISDYKLDSLLGSAGRDNGMILIMLYLLMYFVISRFFIYKSYVFNAFLVAGCVISLLAVLHFFYIDPIGVMEGNTEYTILNFGTTIGNKNTIASYMCIFLPIAIMMFVVQNSTTVRILSAVSVCCAWWGLLVASSYSGYLGFFVVLFCMLLFCVRRAQLLRRLMFALTIMFASTILLRLFSFIMDDKSKGFEAIGEMILYNYYIYIVAAVCALLTGILYLLKKNPNIIEKWPKNILTIIVVAAGVSVVIVCGYLFYKYTFVDTKTDIGGWSHIFRFDDRWGTHRGFMWINGLKDYADSGFINILFGSGCDTFYHVFEPHFAELSARFHNSSTNCIHSEYLNYLITQGLFGLLSYLTIIVSVLVRVIRKWKDNKLVLLFIFPIIAYCAQASVNIYTPVVTPFLFIFVALCECIARDSNPYFNKLSY